MNRWSALALLLAVAVALALRVPRLDTRPLHNDEAVNAVKVSELWQHGRYAYDPDEYHGPTLHYATLPFLWLSGARNADELPDATLRVAPVAFGAGLILLLLLFVDGLGRPAVLWAAFFTAVSPAMVFYSRYFIHEMLLVFFTALTLGAGWRYMRTRSVQRVCTAHQPRSSRREEAHSVSEEKSEPPYVGCYGSKAHGAQEDVGSVSKSNRAAACWAVLTGAGLGLMFATKETFVLTIAAMGLAGLITAWWTVPKESRLRGLLALWNWKHAALALAAAGLVWLLFFSSFFTNFHGLLDSVRTYLPWLKRAGGHSPHIHPWSFYFERLAWFHPVKGPAWSEGLILVLAFIGAIVSLAGKQSPLRRFLALYTILLTAIYCAISYKTPWCLLSFYFGMILLAGVGAAALVEVCRAKALKVVAIAVVLAFLFLPLHRLFHLQTNATRFPDALALQAWRASFVYAADRRNPYVYAQTAPDLLHLVQRLEGIAGVAPAGHDTVVKVIAPESDYWPLPWYLRRFKQVGWYEKIPADPFAPMVIVAPKLDARLDEKSDRKWIMAGLSELRPGKFFELYVELELWKQYVETLPRERD